MINFYPILKAIHKESTKAAEYREKLKAYI